MKKLSTQLQANALVSADRRQASVAEKADKPRRSTVEFLRQFARSYQPGPAVLVEAMPGYSLN